MVCSRVTSDAIRLAYSICVVLTGVLTLVATSLRVLLTVQAQCAADIVITQHGARGLWTHETFLDPGCLIVKRNGTSSEIISAAACE